MKNVFAGLWFTTKITLALVALGLILVFGGSILGFSFWAGEFLLKNCLLPVVLLWGIGWVIRRNKKGEKDA